MSRAFVQSRSRMITYPADTGLVGAWDMRPSGILVPDKSSYGNNGTISGARQSVSYLGDTMEFDGADDLITIGNTGRSVKTVAFWVKPTTTTEDFIDFDGGTHSVEVAAGTVTATGWDTPTIYVNGVANTTVAAGLWHFIVVTTDTAFTASNMIIGNETIYLEGKMGATRIYSDAKTAAWVASEYDRADTALWRTAWGVNTSPTVYAVGNYIDNTPFTVDSGEHTLSMTTINGKSVKAIQNDSDGQYSVHTGIMNQTPQEAAYGQWDIWMYQSDASNRSIFGFISSTRLRTATNGYSIHINGVGNLLIYRRVGGAVVATPFGAIEYVPADTWVKITIRRTVEDEFYIYMNDVLVPADAGTNPFTDATYTASNYMFIETTATDQIAYADLEGYYCLFKRITD